MLRCKMRVTEVKTWKDEDGSIKDEFVTLQATIPQSERDINFAWSKHRPAATVQIEITNPSAFNTLSAGHEFYVDFTAVEKN